MCNISPFVPVSLNTVFRTEILNYGRRLVSIDVGGGVRVR